ncbi:hypothetical protein ACSVHC_00920 [Arthrobacter sp. KNU-44]|uniref:hypothetical protein n=1 Tax=unclassified Arthrobacter TaxID=235627 RepID=UPI003F431744
MIDVKCSYGIQAGALLELRRRLWLMVLLVWISSYRHDFGADEGCDLYWAVAAGDIDLPRSAVLIEKHLIRR